ncbi:UxaA family hydrolase [Clostridium cellulovorans]|uniref:Altronate dehydratase n=1 Tax=Clostridium cellulovorans (strain ATCC 35296 / DSM 3052 / OCM 3 / 743B) TaxID=573061 RepID=D9SP24_CLOC7|nr:altronate dehydratase family protein [Clostridium cellulovorans]ADL51989.1 Altronate dehydratase [Clostridium cellulovorans 743B]
MHRIVKINHDDDVVVLLEDSTIGEVIVADEQEIKLLNDIPKGHKVAIKNIEKGQDVLKYGYSIGKAKEDIKVGEWIHSHNLGTGLGEILEYNFKGAMKQTVKENSAITFKGYVRDNGEVGIRNEIWIINTVGCINKTCANLAREGNKLINDKVDGVYHFEHPFGCSQLDSDLENTRKILANLVNHPNAAGVLVVALGCENNTLESFKELLEPINEERVKFLRVQDVEDEIEEGKKLLGELIQYASKFEREHVNISKLKIGLKCGGSDAFSGVTANPLLGRISNEITSLGGTAIQTEVPEMFGAETILFDRSINKEIFDKSVELINDFKEYFMRYNQVIYENPSPGNKKGGITTLEEKSLGCVQKSGKAVVTDVLQYGDRATKTGLNLISGPGNDQIAVTVLAAAGAHIVLFTTGRGTPYGGSVPTLKISTNTDLYNRKKNWIDFNAGELIGSNNPEKIDEEFLKLIIDTASGDYRAKNEVNDYREIAILKDGVTL